MKPGTKAEKKNPTGTAIMLFYQTISDKINKLLSKCSIKTVPIPKRKTVQMLRSAKAGLQLKIPDVYWIPIECVKVYVRHNGRTIETRCEVHNRRIHLHQPQKSVMAEHSINTGHCTDFSGTSVLEQQDTKIAL